MKHKTPRKKDKDVWRVLVWGLIVNGDPSQIDLPPKQQSGLHTLLEVVTKHWRRGASRANSRRCGASPSCCANYTSVCKREKWCPLNWMQRDVDPCCWFLVLLVPFSRLISGNHGQWGPLERSANMMFVPIASSLWWIPKRRKRKERKRWHRFFPSFIPICSCRNRNWKRCNRALCRTTSCTEPRSITHRHAQGFSRGFGYTHDQYPTRDLVGVTVSPRRRKTIIVLIARGDAKFYCCQ